VTSAARSQAADEIAPRVAILADGELATAAARALGARGIGCAVVDERKALAALASGGVLGWALRESPDPERAARLAGACASGARAGRPLILLVPPPAPRADGAIERAAALAHLRAAGAAVVSDPDVWIEAMALIALFGPPRGPRAALVAGEGSLLAAQADAVVADAEAIGARGGELAADPDAPTDAVLHDPGLEPGRATAALPVPVVPRAELWDGKTPALFGLRAALGAVLAVGRAADRAALGLGPAPREARAELAIDGERLRRQLDRIGPLDRRAGDHETKVLLAAYGVAVTRQAVADTPSAAIRIAKRAGFPVEIKPWASDTPSERVGCPVERGVATAAEVRRAVAAVVGPAETAAVIIRETPPAGREVAVTIQRLGALGWTVVLEAPGAAGPAAAPAPLRVVDATALANHVASTRSGDPEPDRVALANLLRRASHLVVDHEAQIERLELGRVVVGGTRTLVIDAHLTLRPRP
jgi:acetyltransferase